MNLVDILNNHVVFFVDEREAGVLRPVSTYEEDNEVYISLSLNNDFDIFPNRETKVEMLPDGHFVFECSGLEYRFVAYKPAWD